MGSQILLTSVVGDHGFYAVFLLMAIDAVLPAASEAVMVYGGAVAAGAFAGQSVVLFGWELESGFPSYLAIAVAGTVGYTVGSVGGWWIGVHGGRPFLERHGRWLHLKEANLVKAERWFERWEDWAVFLGRITPVIRSFVSIPAGVFRAPLSPLHRPDADRLRDSGASRLAGVGWALGRRWEDFHHAFRYADYAIVATIVAGVGFLGWKLYRRRGAAGDAR